MSRRLPIFWSSMLIVSYSFLWQDWPHIYGLLPVSPPFCFWFWQLSLSSHVFWSLPFWLWAVGSTDRLWTVGSWFSSLSFSAFKLYLTNLAYAKESHDQGQTHPQILSNTFTAILDLEGWSLSSHRFADLFNLVVFIIYVGLSSKLETSKLHINQGSLLFWHHYIKPTTVSLSTMLNWHLMKSITSKIWIKEDYIIKKKFPL